MTNRDEIQADYITRAERTGCLWDDEYEDDEQWDPEPEGIDEDDEF